MHIILKQENAGLRYCVFVVVESVLRQNCGTLVKDLSSYSEMLRTSPTVIATFCQLNATISLSLLNPPDTLSHNTVCFHVSDSVQPGMLT